MHAGLEKEPAECDVRTKRASLCQLYVSSGAGRRGGLSASWVGLYLTVPSMAGPFLHVSGALPCRSLPTAVTGECPQSIEVWTLSVYCWAVSFLTRVGNCIMQVNGLELGELSWCVKLRAVPGTSKRLRELASKVSPSPASRRSEGRTVTSTPANASAGVRAPRFASEILGMVCRI